MNNQTQRFEYKFSNGSLIKMVVVAFAITVGMGYIAYLEPATTLTRVISFLLPSVSPSLFYWILTALGFAAALFTIHVALQLKGISHVELRQNEAFVPSASMIIKMISLPYGSIKNIEVKTFGKQQMVIISSALGESRLFPKQFATPNDFEVFFGSLRQRMTK